MEFNLEEIMKPNLIPVLNLSRNARGQIRHNQYVQQQIKDFSRQNEELERQKQADEERTSWTHQI